MMLTISNFDFSANAEDLTGAHFNESHIQIEQSNPAKPATKKRGRPKKTEDSRDWNDDETLALIEVWQQQENLYNTKHKLYFNRDVRQKSLAVVETKLKECGIIASTKHIAKKLTDLKNYYGAQKRLTTASKSSGVGTDEVFVSPWKFYDHLNFLSDSFTPRATQSNAQNISPYNVDNPPSAKAARKMLTAQSESADKLMSSAAMALEKLVSSRENVQQAEKTEDEIYCELLRKLLSQIPECEMKDELKLNIQRMIIKCKHQLSSAGNAGSAFPYQCSVDFNQFSPANVIRRDILRNERYSHASSPASTSTLPQTYEN